MAFFNFFPFVASHVPNLVPHIHVLSFSTLLGTELYQTFVMTKISYNALPRSAFTTLQKRVFPIYFQGQSLLLFLAALTYPPHGILSLVRVRGVWIPFAAAGVTVVLNLLVYGPRTRQLMIDRIHQSTRDTRIAKDESNVGAEMKALNRKFSKNHAMSIHLNLVSIGAMVWYGWTLASRLTWNIE